MKLFAVPFLINFGFLLANNSGVMRSISQTFGRNIIDCQREMHFSDTVIMDFLNYWNGNQFSTRETGCAIICVLFKLDLVKPNSDLNKVNSAEFAKANGADDNMVQALIELYGMCQENAQFISDDCLAAVDMAKCFRAGVQQLNWTPEIRDLQFYN